EEGVPADLEPPLLLFPDRLGSESLNHAVALRRDAFDRVYAIVEEGQAVVRFDAAGKPAYRLGGVDLSSAKRVRALPEGGFLLEDGQTRWTFTADRWLMAVSDAQDPPRTDRDAAGSVYSHGSPLTCNGVALDLWNFDLADFDVDPFGRLFLLEEGTGRVIRLTVTAWK
ncbi:MAG: hypothetical protein HYY16_02970, partial [Planctomycetes bacterium]|nr:hypothetical protein [Planctomycetota bacterium]